MSFTENVSEHLQVQGSEVQDSHNEIVKDLADVRHQAQDIYQKLGIRNVSRVLSPTRSHCAPDQTFSLWPIRPQHAGVPAVPAPDVPVLQRPDEQAGAHEQHAGVHAALPGQHAEEGGRKASHDPGIPGLGR